MAFAFDDTATHGCVAMGHNPTTVKLGFTLIRAQPGVGSNATVRAPHLKNRHSGYRPIRSTAICVRSPPHRPMRPIDR